MKVFNAPTGHYNEKVNFVDENNVFLGYSMASNCCETFGWFVADKPQDNIVERKEDDIPNLDGFAFDPTYFKEVKNSNIFYEGMMVIFRIVKGGEEKFIHLFNCQNGYYGHGFEFKVGQEISKKGYL